MEMTIKYLSKANKKANSTFVVNDLYAAVDSNRSYCGEEDIRMMIAFTNNTVYTHFITFNFNTSGKDKTYDLKSVTVQLNVDDESLFPDFSTAIFKDNTTTVLNGTTNTKDLIFSTSQNRSFQCKSNQTFTMDTTPELKNGSLELLIYDFQAQAFSFRNDSSGAFDKRVRCSMDQKTSKVVPIAVGAALAGLVVVVLIAYLIGRFRSRKQSSYEALS